MATPPRPTPTPPPGPNPPPPPPKPAAHHDEPNHTLNKPPEGDPERNFTLKFVPLAEDDPNRVVTVGEEQMERSLAYEQSLRDNGGPPQTMAAPEEEGKPRQRAVAGVSPTEIPRRRRTTPDDADGGRRSVWRRPHLWRHAGGGVLRYSATTPGAPRSTAMEIDPTTGEPINVGTALTLNPLNSYAADNDSIFGGGGPVARKRWRRRSRRRNNRSGDAAEGAAPSLLSRMKPPLWAR